MENTEAIISNYRKLEDIKNTTESLMGKIGQLQVDLFNNPDKELEKFLNEVNNDLDATFQKIEEVVTAYEKNKVAPARGE